MNPHSSAIYDKSSTILHRIFTYRWKTEGIAISEGDEVAVTGFYEGDTGRKPRYRRDDIPPEIPLDQAVAEATEGLAPGSMRPAPGCARCKVVSCVWET